MTPETCLAPIEERSRTAALVAAIKTVFAGRNNSAAALQSLATKVLVLGLNAATSIVVARALKPAGRGEMAAIIIWPGFFSALLTLGLPSSMTFNLRRHPERAPETIGAAWLLTLLIGLVTGIVGFVFVPRWLTQYSHVDIVHARWMLLASPLPMLLLFGRAVLEAKGNFFASNLSLWSAPFLTLIWLLALVAFGHVTPLSGGLAYVLATLPVAVILLVQIYSTYRPRFSNLRASLGNLLHFGLRAWGIDLLSALAISEQVLVIHFLSPAGMGTYAVAASLARVVGVFQTSAVIVLFPRIAARSPADVIELTGFTLRVTTFCAAVGALTAGVLGPVLLRSFYGALYAQGGVIVFRLLLGEVVLSGATQVLAQACLALERPGTITAIQALGVGIGLLIMPAMIKEFGAPGAPLALLASSIIRLVITLLSFPYLLKTATPRIWPKREDLRVVIARLASLTHGAPIVQS
jgi:O-antigen/teichoic acid export membrane protein